MSKFKSCPECGAHLDHNETCECIKKAPSVGALRASSARAGNIDTKIIPQETGPVKSHSSWLDLDDLHFRMACAINNVCAIHEAMENGDCSAECYTDALWAAGHFLGMLNKELGAIVTDMRDAS